MSERLILLDVPGVLYSESSAARLGGTPETGTLRDMKLFDPVALGFVRRLFGLAGARVVLPAAWGQGVRGAVIQQLDLQVQAFAPGVPGGFLAEAAAYIAREKPASYAVVTTDVAAAAATLPGALRERLVTTNPRLGLTPDDFQRALALLGVAHPGPLYPPSEPDARVQARLLQLRRAARAGVAARPAEAIAAHP